MNTIKHPELASQGKKNIAWAEMQMTALSQVRKKFEQVVPLQNQTVVACLHATKETAVLMKVLQAGGAKVVLAGSNPLSTQDDVVAALVEDGIEVHAFRGQTDTEYYECLEKAADAGPSITMDDGCDLISLLHSKRQDLIPNVIAGQEETTTGVIRLKAMAQDKALKYPVIAVNDTPTKHLFDNVYGTGQSTLDAIIRSTNILFAGKTVLVVGYGYCGRGVAMRSVGMGARVIVSEIDPVRALQAYMDGHQVMATVDAVKYADVVVTVTGNKHVIRKEHFENMKPNVILANAGHFNVEIDLPSLEKMSVATDNLNEHTKMYMLPKGKRIHVLADGRLVNLAAAEGHPSSVMDMSFSNQALVCEWLVKNHSSLSPGVMDVPEEIDSYVAQMKLEGLGIQIEKLTQEQKNI